ncbi:MAG: type II secretion system ATPase GspE [Planctomycetes bacterium]|jgi:general secretion pathway protein E|nr:type II secretion system ATPase GspE [Planctomycetota bacterium]
MPTLKSILFSRGLLREEDWAAAEAEARKAGGKVSEALVRRKLVGEADLSRCLAAAAGVEWAADLSGTESDPEFLAAVPREFARRHTLLGVVRADGSARVAAADPLDLHPLDEVAARLGRPAVPLAVPAGEIVRAMNRAFEETAQHLESTLSELSEDSFEGITREVEASEDLMDMANKAPIVKLVNTLLSQALPLRASDIHLQPFLDHLRVRYRVDGMLTTKMEVPKKIQEAVISRVKVMGKMDIAERRLPQDGGMSFTYAGREVDVRISSIPTQHGERIVMRLQDKSSGIYRMDRVGLSAPDLAALRRLIRFSHGILLVTGPTGSGKTTTLYSMLSEINAPEKNIITIEEPVEYLLPGISQIQVSSKKGLSFASGLRSILRQDPNVIMVGEIRDLETARIAVQSSLTGHLVLSTLHTNDAPGAVSRLLDLGVEPFLVNSSLLAVVAQRLVRSVCPHCAAPLPPGEACAGEAGLTREEVGDKPLRRGKGCEACDRTGHLGRTGIFEILTVDDEVKGQIMRRESASEIKRSAVSRGMKTLRADALEKMRAGITTPDEVLRVTQLDVL